MLYNLLFPLADQISFLNVFKYLTFRTAGATITSLIIAFLLGPHIINILRSKQKKGQPIRECGPESHLAKKGTPTMGGLLILLASTISILLWADITNSFIWITLIVTLSYGLIGFIDDYLKVSKNSHIALPGKLRLFLEFAIALLAVYFINQNTPIEHQNILAIPFLKNITINLDYFYIIFAMFVIVGASNAVNLTDGLDGLAIVPVMIVAAVFLLITYLTGHIVFANYLQIIAIPGTGELSVFCGALIGAGLGFLWYNAPPAQVFMGDTGSLALGGALGTMSVIVKNEIILAIAGGIFVMEALSVIIQVLSYKTTGKRVFRMAPIHHHFEKKGWAEATVVIRFWIITVILAIIALSSLKLR